MQDATTKMLIMLFYCAFFITHTHLSISYAVLGLNWYFSFIDMESNKPIVKEPIAAMNPASKNSVDLSEKTQIIWIFRCTKKMDMII